MTRAQDVVDASDIVFLTVPDGAIRSAAAALAWDDHVAAVHCSGATPLDALDAARQRGAAIGGFHPMQTFSNPEAAIRSLPGCTITIEADGELARHLAGLAARLECRVNELPAGARARYHAAGAYASQLVIVLLREASRIWQSFGKSEADAVSALLPLARGTLAAIEASGLAAALPGPISRGDLATVEQHVLALARVDREIADLYCTLNLRTIPLALERGSLDPVRAGEFESLLSGLQAPDRSAKGAGDPAERR